MPETDATSIWWVLTMFQAAEKLQNRHRPSLNITEPRALASSGWCCWVQAFIICSELSSDEWIILLILRYSLLFEAVEDAWGEGELKSY